MAVLAGVLRTEVAAALSRAGLPAAAAVPARLALARHGDYLLHPGPDAARDRSPARAWLARGAGAPLPAPLHRVDIRGDALAVGVDPAWLVGTTLSVLAAHGGPAVTPTGGGARVLVEFSSPNMAKPFHVGHLRSTILGSYLARLHALFGFSVTRINYLGDWGKQFGLLGVGAAKYADESALAARPLQHLYELYVRVNRDADADPAIHAEAQIGRAHV